MGPQNRPPQMHRMRQMRRILPHASLQNRNNTQQKKDHRKPQPMCSLLPGMRRHLPSRRYKPPRRRRNTEHNRQTKGSLGMTKRRVLFICTHNSARSQMAEALLRHIYGDKYQVFSAGTNPTRINPLAIKALFEIGIDATKQYSKSLDEFSETEIYLAISVCQSSAKTICTLCVSPITKNRPLIINSKLNKTKNYIVHGFEDPSEAEGTDEEKLVAFRRIRDQIEAWITENFSDEKILGQKFS